MAGFIKTNKALAKVPKPSLRAPTPCLPAGSGDSGTFDSASFVSDSVNIVIL